LVRGDNGYVGAARNLAARHATGEYLLFMDDDNIARSYEIERFVQAARHSGADILTAISDVFCGAAPCDDNHKSERYWLPLGACASLGVFQNCFGDANSLVKRAYFERAGGFTEDYGVGHEDWEFFAAATLAGARLFVVPEPLFWYRVAEGGMLISGDPLYNHARSLRPYLIGPTAMLGGALAFALDLSLATDGQQPGRLRPGRLLHLVRILIAEGLASRTLRMKFGRVLRYGGLRAALRAVALYALRRD
jgi:glycosyltransferase involved in cell wall biosynthesis